MSAMSLVQGRVVPLVSIILASATILLYMRLGDRGRKFEVRRVPGLDALDEAVGRCTELKRPLHYTIGLGTLRGDAAAQTMAGMSVLSYVSALCAKYDAQMIVTCCNYEQLPYLQETVNTAFAAAGKTAPEDYVRFVGQGQGQLSIACQGIFEREKVGANIMLGYFDEECVSIAEKGYRVGAVGIGGTAAMGQVAILAAVMDYVLIGEELYAAGAYVSGDPAKVASIAGADLSKIAGIVLIVVGILLVQLGIPFARWLNM